MNDNPMSAKLFIKLLMLRNWLILTGQADCNQLKTETSSYQRQTKHFPMKIPGL